MIQTIRSYETVSYIYFQSKIRLFFLACFVNISVVFFFLAFFSCHESLKKFTIYLEGKLRRKNSDLIKE